MTKMKTLSRYDHDQVLASYMLSPHWWLVGTKTDASSDILHTGEMADLRHDVWIVRTDDPQKLKDPEQTISFCTSVDVGPVYLNQLPTDLLTAKLLAIELLSGRLLAKVSAYGTYLRLNAFFWIVRWRLSLKLRSFGDLTPALLEDLYAKLKSGGALALAPLEQRFSVLAERVRLGTYPIPKISSGSNGRGRPLLHVGQIGEDLGIGAARLRWDLKTSLHRALVNAVPELERERFIDDLIRPWRWRTRHGRGSIDNANEPDDDLETDPQEDVVDRAVTEHTARIYLGILLSIYDLSRLAVLDHDPLRFNPFADVPLNKRAWSIGRSSARTATVGPEQWLALLDHAARWVMDLSSPVLAIVSGAEKLSLELFPRTGGAKSGYSGTKARAQWDAKLADLIRDHWPDDPSLPGIMPAWTHPKNAAPSDKRSSLNDLLYYLIGACFVLTGAFSARRSKELMSLRVGCAQTDDLGNWWIESYIQKTIRDYEKLPVPPSVGVAVRMLEELSQAARTNLESPFISTIYRASFFIKPDRDIPALYTARTTALLKDFGAISAIPLLPDGSKWNFAGHQLRRAFGIFYYYGYRYANLDALSRFLRHFDPEETRKYITETIPGALSKIRERRQAAIARAAEAKATAPDQTHDRALVQAEDQASSVDAEYQHLTQRLKEVHASFTEVKEGATVDLILEMHDRTERPIGRGAATLYRDLEHLIELARADVRIGSPNSNGSPDELRSSLIAQCQTYAKTKNIEPVPNRLNCGFSPKRGDKPKDAACLQRKADVLGAACSDKLQDYNYADHATCLGCKFGVAFSWGQKAIDHSIAQKSAAAAKAPSQPTRTAAQRKLDEIKERVAAATAAVGTLA